MTSPLWINAGHGSSLGTATIATDGTFTIAAHGLADNQPVMVDTFTGGTGAVLRDDAIYYVTAADTDTFQLVSATGDEVIEFGSTGGADVYTAAPSYDALSLRRSMTALTYKGIPDALGARAGVDPFNGEASPVVTVSGSTVEVHDRTLVLYPGLSSADGAYLCHLTEDTHTLDPADGTNPRIDIVVARVYDDDHDASGRRECVTEYIAGSPAADPDPPATPAGALLLTEITVPQSGGGSATAAYVAPWTVANGGVLPVRDDSEYPAGGLYTGMVLWDRALETMYVRTRSAWRPTARAGGWFHLGSGVETNPAGSAFVIDATDGGRVPAGTCSMMRLTMRGDLTGSYSLLNFRVNSDATTDLYRNNWIINRASDGTTDQSEGAFLSTVWRVGLWGGLLSNMATVMLYNTDASSQVAYTAESGNHGFEAESRDFRAWGRLEDDRLVESIRIGSTSVPGWSEHDIRLCRWWLEGYIEP